MRGLAAIVTVKLGVLPRIFVQTFQLAVQVCGERFRMTDRFVQFGVVNLAVKEQPAHHAGLNLFEKADLFRYIFEGIPGDERFETAQRLFQHFRGGCRPLDHGLERRFYLAESFLRFIMQCICEM